jgi:hypothetical protein
MVADREYVPDPGTKRRRGTRGLPRDRLGERAPRTRSREGLRGDVCLAYEPGQNSPAVGVPTRVEASAYSRIGRPWGAGESCLLPFGYRRHGWLAYAAYRLSLPAPAPSYAPLGQSADLNQNLEA